MLISVTLLYEINTINFVFRFYFDFSATYVGVGMICPYMINISLLLGGILSWGIMWPAIEAKKGDWYNADLPASSLHGIQGYRVCSYIIHIHTKYP